jgi:hypothetical protein
VVRVHTYALFHYDRFYRFASHRAIHSMAVPSPSLSSVSADTVGRATSFDWPASLASLAVAARKVVAEASSEARRLDRTMASAHDEFGRRELRFADGEKHRGMAIASFQSAFATSKSGAEMSLAAAEDRRVTCDAVEWMTTDFTQQVTGFFDTVSLRIRDMNCRLAAAEVVVAHVMRPAIEFVLPSQRRRNAHLERVASTCGTQLHLRLVADATDVLRRHTLTVEGEIAEAERELQELRDVTRESAARLTRAQSQSDRYAQLALKRHH